MEKFSKLIDALLSQSEKGSIPWQASAQSEAFQYSLPKNTIRIVKSGETFYIYLINDHGVVIESVSDVTLDDYFYGGGAAYEERMRQIFLLARRKALKIDEALDSILAQLGVGE